MRIRGIARGMYYSGRRRKHGPYGFILVCSLVFHRPLGEKIKSFAFKRRDMNVLIPLALSIFLLNQNNAWFINRKKSEGNVVY